MKVKSIVKRIEVDTAADQALARIELAIGQIKAMLQVAQEDAPMLAAELDASLSATLTNLKNIAYAHAGVAEQHHTKTQERIDAVNLRVSSLLSRQERVADRDASYHQELLLIGERLGNFVESVERGQAKKDKQLAGLLELEQNRHAQLMASLGSILNDKAEVMGAIEK